VSLSSAPGTRLAARWRRVYCGTTLETGSRFRARAPSLPGCGPRPSLPCEVAIDISGQRSKSVEEFTGQSFDYVITVCDNAKETCPVFPTTTRRIHWSIEDPAAAQGPAEVRLAEFRRVRDELRARLRSFVDHQAKK